MELLLKIGLSLFFTVVWVAGLWWVWTHQLDPMGTVSRLTEKAVAPPEWVATREANKIYQDGAAVGDVSGPVETKGSAILFAQLSNAGAFNVQAPFEYQRSTLRVVRIDSAIGMKVEMTDQGSKTLNGVFEGVLCELMK
jgi:hypothetical protein